MCKRYALGWILGSAAGLATFGGDAQPAGVSAAARFAGAVAAALEVGDVGRSLASLFNGLSAA